MLSSLEPHNKIFHFAISKPLWDASMFLDEVLWSVSSIMWKIQNVV